MQQLFCPGLDIARGAALQQGHEAGTTQATAEVVGGETFPDESTEMDYQFFGSERPDLRDGLLEAIGADEGQMPDAAGGRGVRPFAQAVHEDLTM